MMRLIALAALMLALGGCAAADCVDAVDERLLPAIY